MAKFSSIILVLVLVVLSIIQANAREFPNDMINDQNKQQTTTLILHANAPKADSPTGLDDKKNFLLGGGIGGAAGLGGFAGIAGGLPLLGGQYGGIGGAAGLGGFGGIGGLGGAGGLGGGIGGATGAGIGGDPGTGSVASPGGILPSPAGKLPLP